MCEQNVSALGYTLKKQVSDFPSAAGMSLTKLALVGKNLIILRQREFG
jgi:hypothetical protein